MIVDFCNNCGRPLDVKWNKRICPGEAEGFCNKRCKKSKAYRDRPKEHKRYGVAGTTYGDLGTKFLKMR